MAIRSIRTYKALRAVLLRPFPTDSENGIALSRRSAVGKFPLLVDGDAAVFEATAIVEYLEATCPGPIKLVPGDAEAAVKVRMMDRVFDNHAMNVMTMVVGDAMRPERHRDPYGVERAHAHLDRIHAWLEGELDGRDRACGADFTLADCAAAPSLFYADWVHPIADRHATSKAYRARLLGRPSVARCVEDARPFRAYFPLGAPDRDRERSSRRSGPASTRPSKGAACDLGSFFPTARPRPRHR